MKVQHPFHKKDLKKFVGCFVNVHLDVFPPFSFCRDVLIPSFYVIFEIEQAGRRLLDCQQHEIGPVTFSPTTLGVTTLGVTPKKRHSAQMTYLFIKTGMLTD